jgi:hypothetical protein
MTRFATMKARTAVASPPGSSNGRGWSGSCRLSAPKASGTTAYPNTVAETMKPTSTCHPGNGRNMMQPIRKEKMILTRGTPLSLRKANCLGM